MDRLAVIDRGRLLAEGTPSSLKAEDRGRLRLQVMLTPRSATPDLPPFVQGHTRVGHNLMMVVAEPEAAHAIGWAQEQIGLGLAEEYALGATTLEDVYIRLTGDTEVNDGEAPG